VNIFLYDHVTGGGLAGHAVPAAKAAAAQAIVRAMLEDFLNVPGVFVTIWRDSRVGIDLKLDTARLTQTLVSNFDETAWLAAVQASDAVWLIAPETEGQLERLSSAVLRAGRTLLGCSPKAVRICASTVASIGLLSAAGIDAAAAVAPADSPNWPVACVLRPDGGAGAGQTRVFADSRAALEFHRRSDSTRPMAVQRYIDGEHLCLSMICDRGRVVVLGVDHHQVQIDGVQLAAGTGRRKAFVPAEQRTGNMVNAMAEMVANAIPGLWGYVSVHFALSSRGPVVIEVSPRLAQGFLAVRETNSVNVAELTLDLVQRALPRSAHVPIVPWMSSRVTGGQVALN
jgi:tyramine---L-glutamate ligase